MSTGFVYLRPLSIVCVRALGPYEASSLEAWRQLFNWLETSGMRRTLGCGYGLMHDDQAVTAKERCRYDACVEILPGFESTIPEGFRVTRLPGGAYARIRQIGMQGLEEAIRSLREGWVPSSGLAVDPNRPFVETHLDDPATTATQKRRVDICIPVSMDSSIKRSAA